MPKANALHCLYSLRIVWCRPAKLCAVKFFDSILPSHRMWRYTAVVMRNNLWLSKALEQEMISQQLVLISLTFRMYSLDIMLYTEIQTSDPQRTKDRFFLSICFQIEIKIRLS
ncbi:hypothetical protein KY290_008626 [Solanum tuberosum]|uniref:Secreted protein n=1 Tax=Solanum tuberosum TaxID=4113 RepID=A0ABQ7W9G1_SOLTU|nr:hypothetical protein KY290_008626 [Solanum tuberosum]